MKPKKQTHDWDNFISYPIPLSNGKVYRLWMPRKITKADAKRIGDVAKSLVTEEQ